MNNCGIEVGKLPTGLVTMDRVAASNTFLIVGLGWGVDMQQIIEIYNSVDNLDTFGMLMVVHGTAACRDT